MIIALFFIFKIQNKLDFFLYMNKKKEMKA